MNYEYGVEISLEEEQAYALKYARAIAEQVAFEHDNSVAFFQFEGSNFKLDYDEIRTLAYLLTKVCGGVD